MYNRIGKNARLGDGCLFIGKSSKNAAISFVSTDKDVLAFKKKLCDQEGLTHAEYGTQRSGYGGTKTIWNFAVRTDERLTEVHDLAIDELINDLDEIDIYMWLIDDGSWHKNQHLFHLYCNMLDDNETNLLINQIYKLFGVKPTMRKDRKQDGRSFNYLYFPRRLTAIVRPKFKKFLIENNLSSMYYKFGGLEFESTLEILSDELLASHSYHAVSKAIATARRFDKSPIINETNNEVIVSWIHRNETNSRIILKEAV